MKKLTLALLAVTFCFGTLWAKDPTLTLTSDITAFSPNNDKIADEITFHIKKEKVKSVASWEMQIRDSLGSVKKSFSGMKDMPDEIVWDGKDEFGAPSVEGIYDVHFKAWDKNNKLVEAAPLSVTLDLTPPAISLTAPEKKIGERNGIVQPVTFNFSAVDLAGIGSWKLQLLDQNRQEFYMDTATGSLPSSWTLSDSSLKLPPGKISAMIWVTDLAGNRSSSAPLELETEHLTGAAQEQKPTAAPAPVVEKAPATPAPAPVPAPTPAVAQNQPIKSALPAVEEKLSAPQVPAKKVKYEGPYLQMTSIIALADLFGSNADGKSALLPQAAKLLEPLANAVLLSPGSRAIILGHLDKQKNPVDEKALSSYYAWKVFSYFVKDKGINKESVSVKGMGASVPIADNKTSLGRSRNRRIEIQIFMPKEEPSDKE